MYQILSSSVTMPWRGTEISQLAQVGAFPTRRSFDLALLIPFHVLYFGNKSNFKMTGLLILVLMKLDLDCLDESQCLLGEL